MSGAENTSPQAPLGPAATEPPLGFWAVAATTPLRVAVVDPDGTSVTYGELREQVDGLSHALRGLGIGRGEVIALLARNHHRFALVVLAAEQIGVHVVPLNHHSAADEIGWILGDSQAKLIITDEVMRPLATAALDGVELPATARFTFGVAEGYRDLLDVIAAQPPHPVENRVAGGTMPYTSGTTGRPKGVRRADIDITPELRLKLQMPIFERRAMLPGHRTYLGAGPLYHTAPGQHAFASLHFGYTVILMDGWDSEEFLALVQRHRVTHTHLVPIHFVRLLALDSTQRARYDTSSLEVVMHAGAPCPVHVKHRMIEWLGPIVFEYYAGSEGLVTSVTSEEWLKRPGTVGSIHAAGKLVRILDEHGEELPPGEAGLIYAQSLIPFEYHRDPRKTEATRKDGLFTLGDYGHVDQDGWLFLSDRRSDLILSGGVNIYPAEVESRLTEHPAVADVAVYGVPDEEWGERVIADVILSEDAPAPHDPAGELQEFCRQTLAAFKAPREIRIVSALPRSEAGKLQRRLLRKAYTSVAAYS